uniref:SAM domain-containing protein n=1 Tax=Kalanchoe fedtschenkoi TaxID=63787 RepID=A0A7N0U5U1_KALFE
MYADREEAASAAKAKSSIRERLNRGSADSFSIRRNVTGKRQRQDDDKWEHDLFKDSDTRISNNTRDLRLKLQRKSLQSTIQNGNGSNSGVHDLREKLSGTMHSLPLSNEIPKPNIANNLKLVKKVVDAAPAPAIKKVVKPPSRKNKADTAVDSFLQSLGLEKYLITFKAEEIDMTALVHMSEDDLKALGIPMGPRKKILLALDSRVGDN